MWRLWDYIKEHRKFAGGMLLLLWSFLLVTSGGGQRVEPGLLAKLLILTVSYPQRAVVYTINNIIGLGKGYIFLVGVQSENLRLKSLVSRLEEERFLLQEIQAENERLRELLSFSAPHPTSVVPARVIGAMGVSGYHAITINRGEEAGIRPGLPVVTSHGVVGRVCEVELQEAKVCLLTDRNSAIPILIQRTRSRGIAMGAGGDRLAIRYLSRLDDVEVGDIIISSGLGRVFPKEIRVGEVEEVRRKSFGLFQDVWAKPSANLHRLEEVLIITSEEFE